MTQYGSPRSKQASISRGWGLRLTQDGAPGKAGRHRRLRKAIAALALSCAACGHPPTVLTAFRTEALAQAHCPKDTVVWIDPQSAIYYLKGQGPYGTSNAGRYACRDEADASGMHGVPN
jgi:hypothetical protein